MTASRMYSGHMAGHFSVSVPVYGRAASPPPVVSGYPAAQMGGYQTPMINAAYQPSITTAYQVPAMGNGYQMPAVTTAYQLPPTTVVANPVPMVARQASLMARSPSLTSSVASVPVQAKAGPSRGRRASPARTQPPAFYEALNKGRGDQEELIRNDFPISPPEEPTLMDNTQLFLPKSAVGALGLEPNMDDKGDQKKELWFGRVWELRALIAERYSRKLAGKRQETLTLKKKMELDQACNDPKSRKLLVKMAARWRGAAFRLRCGLAVLEKIRYCGLRGTLVYCHGSGGNSWDNMRICRMICKLGVLVIVPDGFAYPKNTPMGAMRHKDLLPLHKATDNVDYWEGDLMYCSDSSGDLAYSTKASAVLQDPKKFREMYERSYQLRRSELHFIIERLPHFIQVEGIFIGGTSEGAMTVTRFDDQRYGSMILGRFINSFSIEYCYFTPRPEDGRIGGQLEVPTLNIIGTKDQFFGPVDSVAKIVVMDKNTGYGDEVLDGNGYPCLVEQKVSCGLVCLFEDGVHSPCETHDNFLHPLFDVFFRRPHDIWRLNEIWKRSPRLKDLIQLAQSSVTHESKVVQVFCPKMKFPQKMSRQRVEELSQMKKGFTKQVSDLAAQEKAAFEKEQRDTQKMLDELRQQSRKQGGTGFETKLKKNKKGSFYDNDKPLTKAKE